MPSKAINVEYSLTRLGRTIIAPLGAMCRWAKRYRMDVSADLELRVSKRGKHKKFSSGNVFFQASEINQQKGQPQDTEKQMNTDNKTILTTGANLSGPG